MAIGKWPMIINVQSGFTAGNHSVVVTARDILGLTANVTLNYRLQEEEKSKQNRKDTKFNGAINYLAI